MQKTDNYQHHGYDSPALCQAPAMAGELDMLVDKLVDKGVSTKKDGDLILSVQKVEKRKTNKEILSSLALRNLSKTPSLRAIFGCATSIATSATTVTRIAIAAVIVFVLAWSLRSMIRWMSASVLPAAPADRAAPTRPSPIHLKHRTSGLTMPMRPTSPLNGCGLSVVSLKIRSACPGGWVWDSDIRPQGVSVSINRKVGDVELFVNNGFWIIDEITANEKTIR